ncbi:MAG: endolytic transglycosylase MltG [Dysgonamonadaceae bacterium]|jgi:UPF0755 protein|nr:endolytic transglycosylase MltG [Dysgonamonadaceae bacterium]
MEKAKKKKGLRSLFRVIIVLAALAAIAVFYAHKTVLAPFKTKETVYVYIGPDKNFDKLVQQLNEKAGLPSESLFRLIAQRMKYPENIKTGRYAVRNGDNMMSLIRRLRSGEQTAVDLTFNNIRTKDNLAGRLSQQLMVDSLTLLNALNDAEKARSFGFDENTFVAMFIPNTYQVYWDTSEDKLLARMKKEYDAFWNADRRAKAEKQGLTPVQVSTLASIVEEEATYADEYPVVAGLYLNRLHRGMRLEADPTVKFAVGDFALRRILYRHLEIDSPYNTYKNDGLPPGPIRIPSIKGIDATLSPQQNNYLFMCAKDDLSGRHNFAATHAEHTRNAARYQKALNERGIY